MHIVKFLITPDNVTDHTREASASCKLVHCPVGKCRLDNLIHSLPVYIIETGVPAYTTLGSEVIVIDRVLNVDEV